MQCWFKMENASFNFTYCISTVTFSPFFFFQAEDGIRDHCVTGVQTCALPISVLVAVLDDRPWFEGDRVLPSLARVTGAETEERRVGKECRSRWSPYH